MTTVRELHDKAMRLSQLALVARATGDTKRAEDLAREALHYETAASSLVPDDKASEPTRSILLRSAASLAYQCKEFQLAQQLIDKGLAGHPPPRIAQELQTLVEQIQNEVAVVEEADKPLTISARTAIQIEGILDHATSRTGDMVGLTTQDGRQYDIAIHEGFDDLVRLYFKKYVIISGVTDGKIVELTDIHFVDDLSPI